MSIWTTWGSCQNADWDSGGWECGLRSAFLMSSQWGGYSWSSNQMLRSKDLKSIKIKLGNGIYKNSTAVPVSLWWGSLIILPTVLLSIEQHKSISLIITTVLSVKYDFHFTDNKTEIQRNQVMHARSCSFKCCFPNSGIYACLCEYRSRKIENQNSRYDSRVLEWSLVLVLPPCPHLQDEGVALTISEASSISDTNLAPMSPTYIHSGSLSTEH